MAIGTYSELQSAIKTYIGDSSLSDATVQTYIQLAEAQLNRRLKSVRADASLTGTADSANIDVSSYKVIRPQALWLTTYDVDERLLYKADGTFAYEDNSAHPTIWTLDSDNDTINFNCPLDQAHTFRLRYVGRFALSESATTNQLLTDHPDVYLAACLVWGGIRNQDTEFVAGQRTLLEGFISEASNYLAQVDRGQLTVDPALVGLGRGSYNIESDF